MARPVGALILAGIGNSGPDHWQTQWQRAWPDQFAKLEHAEWDRPVAAEWIRELREELRRQDGDVVLVAHSLACLLVAHWAAGAPADETARVRGALLVAVPDPAGPAFPVEAVGFSPLPRLPLPFASVVVVSDDDPYDPHDFGRRCAAVWRSTCAGVGACGHINSASHLGLWPEGQQFAAALGVRFGAGPIADHR